MISARRNVFGARADRPSGRGKTPTPRGWRDPAMTTTNDMHLPSDEQPTSAGGAATLAPKSLASQVPAPLRVAGVIGVAFLLISVWRWEIIRSPPYLDSAMGLFVEANMLYEANFDYRGAYRNETWGTDGGAIAYVISVLPTVIALLMKLDETGQTAITVYHFVNFLCAAIVLAMVYEILRRHLSIGTSAGIAVVIATTPLFASQVDMLGMELPMTAAFAVALWAVGRDRFVLAGVATTIAFACKTTGMIPAIAVVAVTGLRLVQCPAAERRRRLGLAVALAFNVMLLFAQFVVYRWSGLGDRLVQMDHPLLRTTEQNPFLLDWAYACPEMLLLTVLSLGMAALVFARTVWRRGQESRTRGVSFWSSWQIDTSSDAAMLTLACLTVVGILAAIKLMVTFVCPRYWTITVPCVYVLFAILFLTRPSLRRWSPVIVVLLLVWNSANLYESLFPQPRQRLDAERSLAYLADHQASIDACREIEAKCAGVKIVTGNPFTYYLALPRLGFVSRAQHGYTVNAFRRPEFLSVLRMFIDHPCELVILTAETAQIRYGVASLPTAGPQDEVVYTDTRQAPICAYRKQLCNLSPAELGDWYVDHLWYARDTQRAMYDLPSRARFLQASGNAAAALRLLTTALAAEPTNVEVKLELARQLIDAGQIDQGLAHARDVAAAGDQLASAADVIGQGLLQQDQIEDAISEFQKALERDPDHAAARYHLAIAYRRLNDPIKAEATLRELFARHPDYGDARYQLGTIAALEGRYDEAVREFEALLQREPQRADAALAAGEARQRQQRNDEAKRHYRDAIARKPDYVEAMNSLGLLLLAESQLEPAEAWFREAIDVQPQYVKSYNNLAVLLAQAGRLDEAEAQLRTATEVDHDYFEAYNNLGMLLAGRQQWPAARDCFMEALRIRPDHAAAQQSLRLVQAKLAVKVP